MNRESELLHKQELDKNEKKIMDLERQIREKTRELAVRSKEIEEKNLLVDFIRSKISDALKNPTKTQIRMHEIDLELTNHLKTENTTFELQMDELNQKFMKSLKAKFPDITTHDLRICLYIKTGMSSHEIANVMNVLPSSIYISRSRLRKKLGLSIDQDLFGFLSGLDLNKVL